MQIDVIDAKKTAMIVVDMQNAFVAIHSLENPNVVRCPNKSNTRLFEFKNSKT